MDSQQILRLNRWQHECPGTHVGAVLEAPNQGIGRAVLGGTVLLSDSALWGNRLTRDRHHMRCGTTLHGKSLESEVAGSKTIMVQDF